MHKPLTKEEIKAFHRRRVFFVFHTNQPNAGTGKYRATSTAEGWADVVITDTPTGFVVSLFGVGDYRQPWTDGTIIVDAANNLFLHLFPRKAEGQGWVASEHKIGESLWRRICNHIPFVGRVNPAG